MIKCDGFDYEVSVRKAVGIVLVGDETVDAQGK
jgi:hypothetical protein